MFLDDEIFTTLLSQVVLRDKVVADVGCGTGRHWEKVLAEVPARLIGYDVSPRMLEQLRKKYPQATVRLLVDYTLPDTPARTRDVVMSTLALGYMRDAAAAIAEWCRVLKSGEVTRHYTTFTTSAAAKSTGDFHHENALLALRPSFTP